MNAAVIAIGLMVLGILATAIGQMADRQAQDQAWRRIASDRRRNAEMRRSLRRAAPPCNRSDCPFRWSDEPHPDDPLS